MKILIFSSSAGNGHNSTAKRIKEKVLENNPDAEIKIIDSYNAYASPLKAWIMEDGYFLACRYLLDIYNLAFKCSEKSNYEKRNTTNANKDSYCLMYGMLKEIYSFKPDVIISTYIFCSIALRNIKRVFKIPAKTICMTLDYGISPYWECCAEGLDYMFLTGDYMVEPFKKLGYKDSQLIVSGIPVADRFSSKLDKIDTRKSLGLNTELFTLIVMKASFFPIRARKLMSQLSKIKTKIQIIIVNGKDKKQKELFDKLLKKHKLIHEVINVGFTDKMVEYLKSSDLVLGKAGGLSTTECINSNVPSLILNHLPQQEIYNKKYLIENGCAIGVTKNNIAKSVQRILDNPDEYQRLKQSTQKVQKSGTLDKFYDIISKCPTPDYTGLKLNDTKREFIKKINNQRKLDIKNEHKKWAKLFCSFFVFIT